MKSVVIAAIIALETVAIAQPEQAEIFFDAGQSAYDQGRYDEAIVAWQKAYDLSKEPLLLLDIAQANRLAGHCSQAIAAYEEFVAKDPGSERRPLAEGFVRDLEPKCGRPVAKTTPVVVPAVVPKADHGATLRIAGLAIGGGGAAAIAIGIGLGFHARSLGNEVTAACSVSCDWNVWRGKDAAGKRDAAIGYALDGLGAAAIVGGAAMYYLGYEQTGKIVVAPHEGGAVVSWGGSW